VLVLDEKAAPGGDRTVPEVVVADDGEGSFDRTLGLLVGDLLCAHGIARLGLPVFEAHGEIGRAVGAPDYGDKVETSQ